ncbi:MAG: tRNA (adenosine(37)-N6)-dimethylallyltransferase MiaA [Chloroflexi bacterium]|nr:tRNA (adenosine(37)-N6)-dimethylallyltransferase MiaA [Chloroflexota bacterium]
MSSRTRCRCKLEIQNSKFKIQNLSRTTAASGSVAGSVKDQKLLVLLGPTAVGKTEIALKLAQEFNGEIVSADSRLIYRGMDTATAKPTRAEQARVPHHLIDVVAPDEELTLAEYQARAYAAIDDIFARGKLPLLVGGTGLYVRAVVEGYNIPRVPPNPARRAELERLPAPELYARLQTLDAAAAQTTLPNNARRIIRALEVIEATGEPLSAQQTRHPPPYPIYQIGLQLPRPLLYARVDARIDKMIEQGLVDEVRGLVARGYAFTLPSMTGLGYREIGAYLRGEIDLEQAIRLLKSNTRKFIRHQANWFRPSDARIQWFDLSVQDYAAIRELVSLQLE